MKKIFLHVGTHKTGTTSIQNYLFNNNNILKKHNILYPKTGRPKKGEVRAHHLLPWVFLEKYKYYVEEIEGEKINSDKCWTELRKECLESECDIIILSSENFELCCDFEINKIKNYLEGFDVYVIYYFRNQVRYMISFYKTSVLHGYSSGFRDFIDDFHEYCDYASKLKKWGDIFGDEKVLFNIYEKSAKDHLVKDFIKNIDKNVSAKLKFKNNSYKNISKSDKYIIYKKYKNNLFKNYILRNNSMLDNFIDHILSSLFAFNKIYHDEDIDYLIEKIDYYNKEFISLVINQDDCNYFLLR